MIYASVIETSYSVYLPSMLSSSGSVGGRKKMSAQDLQSLMKRRAHLEKQLRALEVRRDGPYTPGVTLVSGEPAPADEQVQLQIDELAAAIAQIDQALNAQGR
jgi:hypothetical protein